MFKILVLIIISIMTWDYFQVSIYKNAIPEKIEIKSVIFHDEKSDFREGCGVAIFKISDASIYKIKKNGLSYFADATLGRDGDNYHRYATWQRTPLKGKENLLRGSFCIDEDDFPLIWKKILMALNSGDAFFTTGREQDIVVIPSLGVLVFSFNG